MKTRNKGFSIVEMVVVIAISAILLTLTAISMNLVSNTNVKAAAKRMSSVLKTARTKAMAKGENAGKVTLLNEDGKLYAVIGDASTGEKELICYSNVTFTMTGSTVTFRTNGTVDNDYTFTFSRAGKIYTVKVHQETGAVVTTY